MEGSSSSYRSSMSWIQSDLEDIEHHLVPTTGRTVFRSLRSSLHSIRARLEGFVGPSDDNDPPAVDDEAQQHQQLLVGEEEGQSHNEVPSSSCVGRLMERLRIAELALSECIPLDRLYNELARRQEVAASNGPLSTPNRMIAADSQSQVQTATMYDRLLEDPAAADTDLPVTPRRRSSALLASRHKMERAENSAQDLTLHGSSSSSISTMRRKSSLILEQEDDDGVMEIEPEEATQRNNRRIDDDETAAVAGTPTILLTAKSRSNLDLARQSVLFPDSIQLDNHLESVDDPQQQQQYVEKPSTVVFSWGRQGSHSLCDHSNPVDFCDARVPAESPVGRAEIVSVSVGEHHTACVTASGQVLIVGENTSGEVDPDRMHVKGFARPFFLESLNQARIVQVSCGFNHTAALRSNGVVLAWGSNEFGQLGHQDHGGIAENAAAAAAAALFCRPAAMVLGPGNRATAVSCGDGFTLCLTSRMNVLACGVEGISGQSSHGPPRPLPALKYLPLVGIVAGRHHAVALTAHGSAFVWGDNAHGECCREYPKHLYVPMPMKPPTGMETHLSGAQLPPPLAHWVNQRPNGNSEQNSVSVSDEVAFVSAACGPDNTILVTKSGSLLVCGSNKQGQLGLNPLDHEFIYHPKLIRHPNASRCFVRAEIGDFHTILLDDWGDVWQLDGTKIVACSPLIMAKGVRCIAAGGEQSVAVMLRPGRQTPTREFSDAMMEQEEVQLAECVEDLIRSIPSDKVLIDNDEYRFDPDLVKISNQAEELFRTPSVLNSLFMDPAELDDLFTKLLNIQPSVRRQTIVSAIERGMRTGLDTFCIDDSRLMWPEQVRFLWLYIQCPMFVDWKQEGSVFDRRGDLILSLCESILGVPYEGYVALMAWATSVYTNDQFVKLLIRPLLSQLKKGLSVEAGAERRSIPVVVAVLRWLNSAAERVGNGVSPETFYSDAISNMHPFTLYNDLDRYKKASKQQRAADFFFCGNSFLISPSVKRNLLQMENEMNMMKVATENGLTFNVQDHTFVFDAFYVLEIDREQILKHTFEKISKAEPSDLRKKLRVVFKGEEGVDAGGVTREFFQLLSAQLFDVTTGMWSSHVDDEHTTWFKSDCSWNDEGFYLSGILVGLAVYNSVLLDVHFPQAVYRKLLALPLGLEDLIDEDVNRNLHQLLDYVGDDVEDVFCLNFDVNWVDLGEVKRKELKPNGSNIAVTSENKEEFVMLYVKWLLVESIYPQYESFEAGFMRVMENSTLEMLRPEELELLVVGSPVLDFKALEENTEYEGYDCNAPVIKNFWKFVHDASPERQLDLMKFTTGSTRAPIGGLGKLSFKLQRAGPDSDNLPTSHTCFNTLLLPDYGENEEKLRDRLGRAILECEGFGLQ